MTPENLNNSLPPKQELSPYLVPGTLIVLALVGATAGAVIGIGVGKEVAERKAAQQHAAQVDSGVEK